MRTATPSSSRRPAQLVAPLAVAALLLVAATGSASSAYADAAGDNSAAYDIASAAISEADGRLTVTVTAANADRLPPDVRIDVWFDLDNNLETGDEGDEALVQRTAAGALRFFRWTGSDLVRRPTDGMTMTFENGVLTYSGPRTAFDSVKSFGLLVIAFGTRSLDGPDPSGYDALPESGRAPFVSPGPESFADRVGDIPVTADIARVRVTDDKSGIVRFAIDTLPSVSAQGATSYELWIDQDVMGETTASSRSELFLEYSGGRARLYRYDEYEEDFELVENAPVRAIPRTDGMTFEVHRSALDDVARFGFTVSSSVWDEDDDLAAADVAPEAKGWIYRLVHRPPVRLIVGNVVGSPTDPSAGQPFMVSVPVRRSDTGRQLTSGRVDCDVRASGRAVRAKGAIREGFATCSLVVPRTASALRGTLTVRTAGHSVRVWFAGAVRFGGGVDE
jgi:hypothetical protein